MKLGYLKDSYAAHSVDTAISWAVIHPLQGSYKKLQPFFKYFSRTTLVFQGPPARNITSAQPLWVGMQKQ